MIRETIIKEKIKEKINISHDEYVNIIKEGHGT